jgi:hypothetical protein
VFPGYLFDKRNFRPIRFTGSAVCGELMDRPVEWSLRLNARLPKIHPNRV